MRNFWDNYSDMIFQKSKMICPECGKYMFKKGVRWFCINYPRCSGNCLTNRTPVDYETRKRRQTLHTKIEEKFGFHFMYKWLLWRSQGKHVGDMDNKDLEKMFIELKNFDNDWILTFIWEKLKHSL